MSGPRAVFTPVHNTQAPRFPGWKTTLGKEPAKPYVLFLRGAPTVEGGPIAKQRKMMDAIEFCTLKETTRRWSVAKSMSEWEAIKDDKTVKRDMLGEEKNNPLRLSIQVGDYDNDESLTEESKSYAIHAKRMKSMAPEDLKQVLSELRMGR